MNNGTGSHLEEWQSLLQQTTEAIRQLAQQKRGDAESLLHLLRSLEAVHQEIRESVFQEALPTNRQELYNFLRDMEGNGGWPYMGRMKLQAFLAQLEISEASESLPEASLPETQLNSPTESSPS